MTDTRRTMIKRISMSVCGVVICAVCVGIFKFAAYGVDPFQSLMSGLDQLISIDFGTLYVIANAALLLFALIADRHYIGINTFINLLFLGYIAQFTLEALQRLIPEPTAAVRISMLIVGIVFISFSLSLYMTADLGVSTYDAVALIVTNTWKKGQFRYNRILTDIVCVLIGAGLFMAGGGKFSQIPSIIGIGTIITAFFMGPLIEFFSQKISRPFLERK